MSNFGDLLFFKEHSYLRMPKVLNVEITNHCPLNCPQCYKDPRLFMHMNFELFKNVVQQASELGVKRVMLNGGEPVTHPDFFSMLSLLSDYKIIPTCFTSGFGIDESFTKELKNYDVEFMLSFNGSNAETHNASRDGFDMAINVANMFHRHNYPFGVNWVARGDNVRDFPNLVASMKKLGCVKITIVCNKADGNYKVKSKLSKDDYDFLKFHVVGNEDFIDIQNCNNIMAQYFYNMPKSRLYGCPAGIMSMCVTVDGAFVPCPHLYFKEKFEDCKIEEYWNKSKELEKLRSNPTHTLEHCRSCKRNRYCNFCRAICVNSHSDYRIGYVDCPLYERSDHNETLKI